MWTILGIEEYPRFLLLVNLSTISTGLHSLVLVAASKIKVGTLLAGSDLCRNTAVGILAGCLHGFCLGDRLAVMDRSIFLASQGHVVLINKVLLLNPVDEVLERD